jgi:hypothetical protein
MRKTAKYVIVRTYSAGVECGELISRNGKEVRLANARKIWSWHGALCLHDIAVSGVGEGSRLSAAVPEIDVTEAIEIIGTTRTAERNLRGFPTYVPESGFPTYVPEK